MGFDGVMWDRNRGHNVGNKEGVAVGKCKECKGILRVDTKHNEMVCEKCGLVFTK